jgi:hypothetical protein
MPVCERSDWREALVTPGRTRQCAWPMHKIILVHGGCAACACGNPARWRSVAAGPVPPAQARDAAVGSVLAAAARAAGSLSVSAARCLRGPGRAAVGRCTGGTLLPIGHRGSASVTRRAGARPLAAAPDWVCPACWAACPNWVGGPAGVGAGRGGAGGAEYEDNTKFWCYN